MTDDPKAHAEVEAEAEAEEAKATPWWKKMSVLIPVITGLLGSLTAFLTLVLPLLIAQPKAGPVAQPTPQVTYVIPQVTAATPLPQERRPRGSKTVVATVSTPYGLFMRSGPSEKTKQLVKLEQNAQVKVSNCRSTVYIDEVEGQWCQASYKDEAGNSHRGWVFNAYLINESEDS